MDKILFDNPFSVKKALELLNINHGQSYEWYPVNSKCGNIVEIGGTYKEITVSVIELDEIGDIKTYANGFTKTLFSISIDKEGYGSLDLPNYHTQYNITKQKLIDMIENKIDLNLLNIGVEIRD